MKTIEEKIRDNAIEFGRINPDRGSIEYFSEGAHWLLSELTPIMDQMRKSLTDAKLMLEHQQLEWTDTYKEIKAVLQNEPAENTDRILDGSLTGDDARDVIVQQWLRLTEELFKKIK